MSHNLFFALWPDDDVRARIASVARQLKKAHAPRGRWIEPHRYHLTLRYLGAHASVPDALLAAAYAAGNAARAASFGLVLDTTGSFANRRIPWWLGCAAMPAGLDALWTGIEAGLRSNGVAIGEPAPRVAHVTILRDADRPLAPARIESIVWPVCEFVLIDSLLGPEPTYTILSRWPLAA